MTPSPHLSFGPTTEPPFGWSLFLAANPERAQPCGSPDPMPYSPALFAQLARVNAEVNEGVAPGPAGTGATAWEILPINLRVQVAGSCHDIALTKWALLGDTGWPTASRLLWEVVAPEHPEQHHLVVVARTDRGDFALDNLIEGAPPLWFVRHYESVRIQSPDDPNEWREVA